MYEELYEEFKKELGDEIRKELGNEIRKELGDEIRNKIEDDIRKRTKAESIAQIMINLKVSFEKALKTLNIPKEEQEEYAELIHCFYPNMMQFK